MNTLCAFWMAKKVDLKHACQKELFNRPWNLGEIIFHPGDLSIIMNGPNPLTKLNWALYATTPLSKIVVQVWCFFSNHLCCMWKGKLLLGWAMESIWMNGWVNESEDSCERKLANFVHGESLWLDFWQKNHTEFSIFFTASGYLGSASSLMQVCCLKKAKDMRSQGDEHACKPFSFLEACLYLGIYCIFFEFWGLIEIHFRIHLEVLDKVYCSICVFF